MKSQDFYKQFVNPAWVKNWEQKDDLLHLFILKLAPDASPGREVQITVHPGKMTADFPDGKIVLEPSAWIDVVIGHFIDGGKTPPDLKLIDCDYDFVRNYVLSRFRGENNESQD